MPKSLLASSAKKKIEALYPEGGPGRHIKSRLKNNELLVGLTLNEYTRPSLVKMYQRANVDFMYIEYEHGLFIMSDFTDTVLSARDNGLPVISKTPQLERQEVSKLLESGVIGIQLPRTESRDQILELYDYIKFPPKGSRAIAPGYGNSDYLNPEDKRSWIIEQDLETTLVVHIETKTGYHNAESIISTTGVDMVYVGPADFSVEMGQPWNFDHPDVIKPMEEILALCKKHHVPFGTSAFDINNATSWVTKGTQFFLGPNELDFISSGATDFVNSYREISRNQ